MFFDTDFLRNDEIWLQLDHTAEADPIKDWVPAYYFNICLPDGTPVGKCDLRIGHNEKLYIGGNIGYSVDEPYRGHHYAGKACRLLFELAKKHELGYVYISCNVNNAASARTCEWAGGTLAAAEPVPEDSDMYQRGYRHVFVYRFEL